MSTSWMNKPVSRIYTVEASGETHRAGTHPDPNGVYEGNAEAINALDYKLGYSNAPTPYNDPRGTDIDIKKTGERDGKNYYSVGVRLTP